MLSPRFTRGGISQTLATRKMGLTENPIQTLASPSLKTAEGPILPGLTMPISKTILGPYRMGEVDGNGAPSAIPMPYDIFPPNPHSHVMRPQRSFENVGNNVFQPQENSEAIHALISRLGEQKFKAKENEKYAAYQAIKKLEREITEIEKTASPADLGQVREIVRSAVEVRRKQNEDDYLRRMLDAGMSVEDANDELEGVRRASALQEAKTVEDRTYQSKLLLTRLAKSRGLTSNINEPLNTSGAIMNPMPSDSMATAAGNPADGFGNAPLDVNRQYMTPAFYSRILRKSKLTQESADRDAALNNLIASGEVPIQFAGRPDLQEGIRSLTGISEATLSARERQLAIENTRERLAATAEALLIRPQRLMSPLPIIVFCDGVLTKIYDRLNRKQGELVRSTTRLYSTIDNMAELLVGINTLLNQDAASFDDLRTFLRAQQAPIKVTAEFLHAVIQAIDPTIEYITVPIVPAPFRTIATQQELDNEVRAWATLNDDELQRRRMRRGKGTRKQRQREQEAQRRRPPPAEPATNAANVGGAAAALRPVPNIPVLANLKAAIEAKYPGRPDVITDYNGQLARYKAASIEDLREAARERGYDTTRPNNIPKEKVIRLLIREKYLVGNV